MLHEYRGARQGRCQQNTIPHPGPSPGADCSELAGEGGTTAWLCQSIKLKSTRLEGIAWPCLRKFWRVGKAPAQ